VVEVRERARAVNRARHRGCEHAVPFGLLRPAERGVSRTRQSSAVAGNDLSGLTRDRVVGEDQIAKSSIPGSGRCEARPKGGLSCFWASGSPESQVICDS
jgi:hypothetical protein